MRTHGLGKPPEYSVWAGIKRRCYNPQTERYARYGGRGIVMCDAWRDSFAAFFADMGCRPSLDHEIDRIDADGPYAKENCRWATRVEQANNKTNNHRVTCRGETLTLAQWGRRVTLSPITILKRLTRGFTPEQAIFTPELTDATKLRGNRYLTHQGETHCVAEWARLKGLNQAALSMRLNAGWSIGRALTIPLRPKRKRAA